MFCFSVNYGRGSLYRVDCYRCFKALIVGIYFITNNLYSTVIKSPGYWSMPCGDFPLKNSQQFPFDIISPFTQIEKCNERDPFIFFFNSI